MIQTGLVSVTFRKLTPAQIVAIAMRAGLGAIEWGGDIHVPHGNLRQAAEVARMSGDAGLCVSSYGSYYVAGEPGDKNGFSGVLDTALALGAPVIRVWAGSKGAEDASIEYQKRVIENLRDICALAWAVSVKIACEFHDQTLTDSAFAAIRLMQDVGCENMKCYWQPRDGASPETSVWEITQLSQRLSNVHVFCWDSNQRLPLAQGAQVWARYMQAIAKADGERYALLEFVRDDSIEQLMQDACVLQALAADLKGCSVYPI